MDALGHAKRLEDKSAKGKLAGASPGLSGQSSPRARRTPGLATIFPLCQDGLHMKRFALGSLSFLLPAMICTATFAQTPSPEKAEALLDALTKKVDLQNAKIDALSQQILKLEQHVSAIRPGVMIGETPAPVTTEASKPPQTGNSHVVAKGETLTSIAKMHKVSVEELQKFNHIENDRALQIGQTIMIPASAASPSPSVISPND